MDRRKCREGLLVLTAALFSSLALWAQPAPSPGQQPATAMPSVIKVPPEAQPSANFDAEAATRAYLAQIPADATARSNAYFEGGYWLILWDFLYGAVLSLLLLKLRWSAGMRSLAERITRFKPIQTALYWVQYLVVVSVLGFPLAAYEGFFRERQYGLMTQTFGPWMGDQFKFLLVNMILGGILVVLLFGVARRFPRVWPVLGAAVTMMVLIFTVLIGPVYLQPIFYHPKPLQDPKITQPILSMARANGIPVHDVYQIDESTKSTRMSANVSGFGKTMRITLNDNLLRRGSPEEIQMVMGHEMGHYVLNHVYKGLMEIGLVIVAGFAVVAALFERLRRRNEGRWRVRDVGDLAGLPLGALLLSACLFLLTPVLNSIIRVQEYEADLFGLNAAQQPDGFAQVALKLSEYRKLEPGPLEEIVFFDHPSGRTRIFAAMRWKAEHPEKWTKGPSAGR